MQKRFLSLFAAAMIAVILFSSCSKDNKQGRYIPSAAGVVFHLNGESIATKLPWEEVKQNDLFKEVIADTTVPALAKTILQDPETSGINVKSDLIAFVVKDSLGGYAAFEGFIKDEAKFKQFLTGAHKDAKETTKDGYTYFTDSKSSVAYNKERFIATMNTPQLSAMDKGNTMGMAEVKDRDMAAVAAQLINLKEDASLAKNEKFTELVSTKGDAHFWFNAEHFNAAGAMGAAAAMVNLTKLYEGAITTATVSFDNGKITADLKSYGGKEITELYKKYSGSAFDQAMVKNIPSQNVAGLFAFNFKPEGLREFLKLLNMEGFANIGAGQLGFTLDDFVKANKGDILFAVTDIADDTLTGKDATVLFSASVGDKAAFGKLIQGGKKAGGPMLGEEGASKFGYGTNDKYFAFSNKKTAADAYLAGSSKSSFSFLDKISGGPFGGYVNFQYIMNAMKPKAGADSLDAASFDASVKMWDNMIISGGNFKDGGLTQHWEVSLVDKNTNSLKQLNSYAGKMGAIEKKKKAQREAMWSEEYPTAVDSTIAVPVPVAP